jgi:hypothetical protein
MELILDGDARIYGKKQYNYRITCKLYMRFTLVYPYAEI